MPRRWVTSRLSFTMPASLIVPVRRSISPAALSTAIEPTGADANGTARIAHLAKANLDYTVNSWLRLRASADWGVSVLEGSGETEHRHGLGAGADYMVNAHTSLGADYAYGHRDNSTSGAADIHTLSVGVTIKR
jgi:hypothetical protein